MQSFITEGEIPHDMRDANSIALYNHRGSMSDSNTHRGISLLGTAGKAFAGVILHCLLKFERRVYPESQCGFISQRSTAGMIFSVHLSSTSRSFICGRCTADDNFYFLSSLLYTYNKTLFFNKGQVYISI